MTGRPPLALRAGLEGRDETRLELLALAWAGLRLVVSDAGEFVRAWRRAR